MYIFNEKKKIIYTYEYYSKLFPQNFAVVVLLKTHSHNLNLLPVLQIVHICVATWKHTYFLVSILLFLRQFFSPKHT